MKRKVLEISTGILRYDGMSNVLISLIDNAPTDKVEVSVLLGMLQQTRLKLACSLEREQFLNSMRN